MRKGNPLFKGRRTLGATREVAGTEHILTSRYYFEKPTVVEIYTAVPEGMSVDDLGTNFQGAYVDWAEYRSSEKP